MNSERPVLVCVTAQQSSENLVKAGKNIAEKRLIKRNVIK